MKARSERCSRKTPRKPRQPPVLVTCFGGVWRLSAANWKRFLQAVAADKDHDLDHFGTYLGHTNNRYSMREVRKLTGLSLPMLYRRAAAGALRILKDGRRSFVTHEELTRYLASMGPPHA